MLKVADAEMWAGLYGVQYTTRFAVDWRERITFLRTMLGLTGARSILDVGTNAGWNLRALREIDPTLEVRGVEINPHTAQSAASMGFEVWVGPALAVGAQLPATHDLVITSGMLIHIESHLLLDTMRSLIEASRRWVLAVEYHAEEEVVRVEREGAPRTWGRPFGELYKSLGLTLVAQGRDVPGYLDCDYWLLRKPEA